MAKPSLDDYIDVAERILQFKEKHPDGSLQTIDWCVSDVAGKTFIVYRAAAYRTPDDPRPGHGMAWEPFPGPTSFTKDSELMNAETAAWGRAIVAVGIAANRKIASRQEVKARQTPEAPPGLDETTVERVLAAIKGAHMPMAWYRLQLMELGVQDLPEKITQSVIRGLNPTVASKFIGVCEEAVRSREAAGAAK